MIRTLSLIAIAGFVLSVACISGAIAIAGPDAIASTAWAWSQHEGRWVHRADDWGVGWTHDADHGREQASRDLPWTGGETLAVDLPANVSFTQAEGPAKLTVRGPSESIAHVAVRGGHLVWEGPPTHLDDVSVELTAPKVTHFELNGSGALALHDYKADALAIVVNGSGDITAQGSARSLTLSTSGSGDADLSGLSLDRADVKLSGSGNATLAPKSEAKLEVSGSGEITLQSQPKRLETNVTGSGHITAQGGEASAAASDDSGEPAERT